jgi:hypothetical protein
VGVKKGGTDFESAVKIVDILEEDVNKKNSESQIFRGNLESSVAGFP